MKKRSLVIACAALGLAGIVGCSDDPTGNTNVNPTLEFKQNATYTYEVYDRDQNNQRMDTSRKIQIWTVIQTGLSYQGRTGVSKIASATYNPSDMATPIRRDTVYVLAQQTGEVYIYNMLATLVKRVQEPIVQMYADSIPALWTQITNTKISGSAKFSALPMTAVQNITVQQITGVMQLRDTATHQGQTTVTAKDSTYNRSYSTDHNVMLLVESRTPISGIKIVDDSMKVHFDVDLNAGIVRQSVPSDKVTVTIPLQGSVDQPVQGFEMVLISYTK